MAVNILNGKKYIGKNKGTVFYRKHEHKREALKRNSQTHFHNAIRKYGFESFKWYRLELCLNNTDAVKRERFYINMHDSVNSGYNLSFGGDGPEGHKQSEKSQQKKRNSNRGNSNSSRAVINSLGEIFESVSMAEKQYKNSKIREVCLEKRNSAAGLSWKFYTLGIEKPEHPQVSRRTPKKLLETYQHAILKQFGQM